MNKDWQCLPEVKQELLYTDEYSTVFSKQMHERAAHLTVVCTLHALCRRARVACAVCGIVDFPGCLWRKLAPVLYMLARPCSLSPSLLTAINDNFTEKLELHKGFTPGN